MRIAATIARVDALFNAIQRVREGRMARRLTDAGFVWQHFPYHEIVARKETAALAVIQANLMAAHAA